MSPLFPASVVGSMPRSAFVRDLINDETTDERQIAREPTILAVRAGTSFTGEQSSLSVRQLTFRDES